MNKEQQLAAVKEAVYLAWPEGKALTFGCRVRMVGGEDLVLSRENEHMRRTIEMEGVVIGHQIHLDAILLAITANSPPFPQEIVLGTQEVKMLLGMYKLPLPLDDQTPETIAFLYQILVKQ